MCRPSIPQELGIEIQNSEHVYSIPFLFVIPEGTEFASVSCRAFPPSFNARNAYFSFWSPMPFPDISISYDLQVVLTYNPQTTAIADSEATVMMTEPITFLPYTEVPPPISTESFPGEFKLDVHRPLWKSIFHGRLGSVTISTKEPSPLVYSPDHARASTECVLHITVEGDLTALQRLRYIAVEAQPAVCAKTYYALKTLRSMPTESLATSRGPPLHT